MTEYLVEPIGAEFSNTALTELSKRFNRHAGQGYKLQLVFQVTQPGCLGIGQGSTTYVAVYAKGQ